MQRLTVDARQVGKRGISTYSLNLLAALRQVDGEIRISAIVRAGAVNTVSSLCDEIKIVDAPIYTLREQLRIPLAARDCDLLHVPHYNVPVLYKGPLVVTIHDLTHVTEPALRNTAKAWLYARPMLHIAGRKAAHVITGSKHSKKGIVERLGVPAEKISVIYHGVGSQFQSCRRDVARAKVRDSLGIDSPYLLFIGSLKPHKNLSRLVQAFARIRSRRQLDHVLLLAGDDRIGRKPLLEECEGLGLGNTVRHVPWVPAELLPTVYAAADLLVVPSTNEGFGLPVVEAMACGTPVVCSDAASLPEVGGDAVVYFDPHNVEEMASTIERLLDSPSLQAEMREKGKAQAAKFSWQECARRHLEVYRMVLAG